MYISEVKADILAETSLIEANLNNMVQDQIKQSFESTRSEQTKNDDRIMEHVQSEMEGLYKKLLDFQDAAKEDHVCAHNIFFFMLGFVKKAFGYSKPSI